MSGRYVRWRRIQPTPRDQQSVRQESRGVMNLWDITLNSLFAIRKCGSCWPTYPKSGIIADDSTRVGDRT